MAKMTDKQKDLLFDFIISISQVVCLTAATSIWFTQRSWIIGSVLAIVDIINIRSLIRDIRKLILKGESAC